MITKKNAFWKNISFKFKTYFSSFKQKRISSSELTYNLFLASNFITIFFVLEKHIHWHIFGFHIHIFYVFFLILSLYLLNSSISFIVSTIIITINLLKSSIDGTFSIHIHYFWVDYLLCFFIYLIFNFKKKNKINKNLLLLTFSIVFFFIFRYFAMIVVLKVDKYVPALIICSIEFLVTLVFIFVLYPLIFKIFLIFNKKKYIW